MSVSTVTRGVDTYVNQERPSEKYFEAMVLQLESGSRYAYLQPQSPVPAGAMVVSALLTVYARGASTGARTLTCRRLSQSWKARQTMWRKKPAVVAGGAPTAAVTALANGDAITFDVTAHVAAIAAGATWYGWRIETNAATMHKLHAYGSADFPPTLVVEYLMPASAPTRLRPSGLFSVAQPTLQWLSLDQAKYRVQIDAAADEVTPDYDSGLVVDATPMHPLEGTPVTIADGASTQFRVLIENSAGEQSPWSDWTTITRDVKGTLTLTAPAAEPNNVVLEPTPPLLGTMTGETLESYELAVTPKADRTKVLHLSEVVTDSVIDYTLPAVADAGGRLLISGREYSLRVRAWDTKTRSGSVAVGDQPYVELWRDFTMIDGEVEPPAGLSVNQVPNLPINELRWSRAAPADAYSILRDGVELEVGVDPSDVAVPGTIESVWRDLTPRPGIQHIYTVKAVENGEQSVPCAPASRQVQVEGTWLLHPIEGWYICVAGVGTDDWTHSEVGETVIPLGARAGFRITQVLGGLAGTFTGLLRERDWTTVEAMEADFWRLKAAAPHDDLRLVADQMNIPVQAFEMTCATSDESYDTYQRRRVRFGFYQTGEFEFEGRV